MKDNLELWIGLGLIFGVVIGVLTGRLGIGISFGLIIGASLGVALKGMNSLSLSTLLRKMRLDVMGYKGQL
ncbi:hypothetical protein QP860_03990 [Aerococcus sp. UMB1112A]|uniref:hypothetical protein n=1 Tax=Aerococcus sp. UMB1112A TaxID=3050609 RepID=UPI00254EB04D|nr:hypothetical protein [Aerococcus sp. UMB1112A]MDK8502212.1 hypothetical protein [Aerococcus sp. UMB1112A]